MNASRISAGRGRRLGSGRALYRMLALMLAVMLALMLTAGAPPAVGSVTGATPEGGPWRVPPLVRIAAALATAEPGERVRFARVALEQMSAAYAEEADALRGELAHRRVRRRDGRWLSSTLAYARDLRALAASLTPETPVEVMVGDTDAVWLVVGDAMVVVSGPRIGQPQLLERRIVTRYCADGPCELRAPALSSGSAPGAGAASRAVPRSRLAGAVWSFADGRGPAFTTGDGLEFLFRDSKRLHRKREVCASLVAELRSLAAALREAAAFGAAIEWGAVEVVSLGPNRPEQVVLNRRAEYLLLELPVLAQSARLQRLALPWIRARAQGRSYQQSFADAEQLLSAALDAPPR